MARSSGGKPRILVEEIQFSTHTSGLNDHAIKATWLSRSYSRSNHRSHRSHRSNRPSRCSSCQSSYHSNYRSSRRSSCRSNRRSSPLRSNSSRSNSSSSIPVYKVVASLLIQVIAIIALYLQNCGFGRDIGGGVRGLVEEAAVLEIVTRGELRAWTVVSMPYS